MKAYTYLAQTLGAYITCVERGNTEWEAKHLERIRTVVYNLFPSGSGFDNRTELDAAESKPNKLLFHTSFHHMDESGGYDGWTDHTVTVRPDAQFGYRLTISGRDRNDIKDHIAEAFSAALDSEVTRYGEWVRPMNANDIAA